MLQLKEKLTDIFKFLNVGFHVQEAINEMEKFTKELYTDKVPINETILNSKLSVKDTQKKRLVMGAGIQYSEKTRKKGEKNKIL
jgi:predicted transcriptional regulator